MKTRIQRIQQSLRPVARSAFAAAVFAALALGLSIRLLPSGRGLRSERTARSQLAVQQRLHRAARLYLRILARAGLLRITLHDVERLRGRGPHLVVSNHPTLVDFVVLCSLMPQADCIVNPARARNPLLRQLVRAAGYVRNDAGAALVRECAERLGRGRSLVVFPEGTRSPAGALGPFQRGAAHIALNVGCDIVPVVITCDPPALWKRWKWSDLPEGPIHVTVRVREPVSWRPIGESGFSSSVAARKL
ncbi:MAG TPA: lysophospholipid acyltransferase family protein, partial [Myxococcota bacterium]